MHPMIWMQRTRSQAVWMAARFATSNGPRMRFPIVHAAASEATRSIRFRQAVPVRHGTDARGEGAPRGRWPEYCHGKPCYVHHFPPQLSACRPSVWA